MRTPTYGRKAQWEVRRLSQRNYSRAHSDDVGFEALAAAIVMQAVEDYKTARRILAGKGPKVTYLGKRRTKSAELIIEEVELFLNSQWFGLLCDIDPEMILRKLRQSKEG